MIKLFGVIILIPMLGMFILFAGFSFKAGIIAFLLMWLLTGVLINISIGPPWQWRIVLTWWFGIWSTKIRDWQNED